MEIIRTRARFMCWAAEQKLRLDWHEPDEQGITARVEGTPFNFDNAGFWPIEHGYDPGPDGKPRQSELHVILTGPDPKTGEIRDLAAVNLATLCAWASEPRSC